jgi:hypothetical protein
MHSLFFIKLQMYKASPNNPTNLDTITEDRVDVVEIQEAELCGM